MGLRIYSVSKVKNIVVFLNMITYCGCIQTVYFLSEHTGVAKSVVTLKIQKTQFSLK